MQYEVCLNVRVLINRQILSVCVSDDILNLIADNTFDAVHFISLYRYQGFH